MVDLIVQQQLTGEVELGKILTVKKELRQLSRLSIICQAANLHNSLDAKQKRLITMTKVKGSSIWLTSLPLDVQIFFLHKGEFRDALCLRYGWSIPNTPLSCICGTKFDVDHALNCRRGGFTIQRHNELRDLTASLLTDVCHNVATEPPLQPLGGESFNLRSANTNPQARLDIRHVDFGTVARMRSLT